MVTAKTHTVRTLIIGGGLTGLATAYALEKRGQTDYLVAEANSVPGGLCASTFTQGYTFDYGGHLLHLHTSQGKKWIKELLGSNLQKHRRYAFIYTHGMRVPYPFQTNLWALRPELKQVCLDTLTSLPPSQTPPKTFEEWCLQSFGWGMYEAFFRPYNEKLWGRKLSELTCDWCGPFVPAPARPEMLQGAYHPLALLQGYNATFYYPVHGGIGVLVNTLAARIKNLRLQTRLTRLDLKHKTAWLNDKPIRFDKLVSTIPLPNLVQLLDGHTPLKQAASGLEAQAVTVYHLAIARRVKPFSWIYCPDAAQPFYRVGMTNSFAPHSVPHPDTSLFYIELPGRPPQTPQTERKIWEGLLQKDIIAEDDVLLFSAWQTIPTAYVIFNTYRAKTVPPLLRTLEKEGCYSAGRYGRWEYSFMESSLLQAEELAQKLA